MKIAIGSDHGGFTLKETLKSHLEENGHEVIDFGTDGPSSVDYPDYAEKVCKSVVSGETEKGILVCGTGIGMSIAANKMKGIRAALLSDVFSARATRQHNDANVMCLGERVVGAGLALMIADEFLSSEFEGGRHSKRIDKITKLEEN